MFEKITIRAINRDGWPIDFELKAGEQPAPALKWLLDHDYEPATVTRQQPAANPQPPTGGSFLADKLTATVDDGNAYWKVRGGQYTKFGVTIWPEALVDAGFDFDELNPMKPVDLSGWTAHYVLNDNGKPKKVVKLVQP